MDIAYDIIFRKSSALKNWEKIQEAAKTFIEPNFLL